MMNINQGTVTIKKVFTDILEEDLENQCEKLNL